MKKLIEQIMKFGIVGVLSFGIDFGIYSAFVYFTSVPVLVANFFGFTISVIFNYLMSMKFVFQRNEDMDRKSEFTIFVILSLIGLGLNELLVWLFVEYSYENISIIAEVFSYNMMKMIGKILATGIVMVYNFISRKIFLEKK
ncbi:MAG: GtrA family protein [Lachnospiraceae bacterium]|nr:GtrA family protein [Lachnospiraceae bacterium]